MVFGILLPEDLSNTYSHLGSRITLDNRPLSSNLRSLVTSDGHLEVTIASEATNMAIGGQHAHGYQGKRGCLIEI